MSCAHIWKSFALSIFLSCSLPHALAGQPASSAPPELLPVPKALAQGRIDRPLREKYKAEFASRDPKQRGDLGRTLREMADKETDPTAKFVYLREARDLAIDAGDFSYSIEVIDDMARTFSVDAQEMKATALAFGIDKARVAPEELARCYLKVCDESLAVWNTDLAQKSAYLATKVARGNAQLMADAKEHERIAKIRNRELSIAIAAKQKLDRAPDDPASNLILGRHLCVNLNRWAEGLPMLAKSAAGTLQALAERDLAGPRGFAATATLADDWWEFSDVKAGIPAGAARRRAAFWYAKALPGLEGEQKATAEKRLKEAGDPSKQ